MITGKKWYQSLSIMGALTTAVGYLARPELLDLVRVLPLGHKDRENVAAVLTAAGVVATVLGIRRAIPDATLVRTDEGVVKVHDPSGVLTRHLEAPRNEYGETAGEEAERRRVMDAAGGELRRTIEAREAGKSKP